MSRGFVKESDQEQLPIVPPRAYLPEGMVNYVTQAGYDELVSERDELITSRDQLSIQDENEKRVEVNYINAKLQLVNDRISTAKIIDLDRQPENEVRFGATVSLTIDSDSKIHTYQIVGVDEANVQKGKIAFNAPIAKILTNKKVGEIAILPLEKATKKFTIVSIKY